MDRSQVDSVSALSSELQRIAVTLESLPTLDGNGSPPRPTSAYEKDSENITLMKYQITDTARKLIQVALGPREALLRFSFNVRSNLHMHNS
jgi:hypothetical protein